MSKKYFDVTLDLKPKMLVFPGDPEVEFIEKMSIATGDIVNLTLLSLCSHTGTHMDAPKHFYDNGLTIDKLNVDYFIGKAKVFEIPEKEVIKAEDLKHLDIKKGDIIILKTLNSKFILDNEFYKDFTYLDKDAAEYLAAVGIKTFGFDYLSIDKYGANKFYAHYILLKENIVIIEGLDLRSIIPGEYDIIALPLKIIQGNGSPARVILWKD